MVILPIAFPDAVIRPKQTARTQIAPEPQQGETNAAIVIAGDRPRNRNSSPPLLPRSSARARLQSAQGWPQRPVSLIVPFPAGGGTDAFARPLAAQLEMQLKQRFLIDNRGGRRRHHRRERGRQGRAERLHLPGRRSASHHRAVALSEARLRHREGFHPDRRDRDAAAGDRRQSGQGAGQDAGRVHRLCQGQSRTRSTTHRPAWAPRISSRASCSSS